MTSSDTIAGILVIAKLLTAVAGVIFLLSGLDDLFIDACYAARVLYRRLFITPRHLPLTEDALRSRQGVCQDFAHIMIALVRNAGIPCRYVSGYLCHSSENAHPAADGATHAWVEALLPGIGWIGFDPTINRLAGEKHIRTAIGRDYADVPPTMGMMKGKAGTQLQVRVRVTPSQAVLPPDEEFAADEEWSQFLEETQQTQLIDAQQQ